MRCWVAGWTSVTTRRIRPPAKPSTNCWTPRIRTCGTGSWATRSPRAPTGRRSSMTSAPAIGFDYRPSRLTGGLLGIVTALGLVAVALSGAPLWLKLVIAAGSLALAFVATRRLTLSRIAGVGYGPDGWTLYQAARTPLPA